LSLAVALVGDPKLLVLDEPSSGMDPYARRQMWTTISTVSKKRCVILTTHSMEECEALCGRLTIMSMGKMQCLGSVQHLKSRFGSGYSIEMRVAKEQTSSSLQHLTLEEKIKIIQDSLPLKLDESRVDYIRFTGDNDLSLELGNVHYYYSSYNNYYYHYYYHSSI
jgi:ABC-type multidrug transport system ATPase subunit